MPAGRAGESASHGLTENLQHLGFETDRLKTGTPPRIDRRTVEFSELEAQHGDEEVCILHAVKLTSPFVLCYLHS
jgi:tRNA uridine 5-carboxymethylaminomethyl modification enzyme